MKCLPKIINQIELEQLFMDIENSKENGVKGILFNFAFFFKKKKKLIFKLFI
jgi:hypothetical protein